MVYEKIREILSRELDIEIEKINHDTLIVEDLRADSLDIVELMMSLEDEFNIAVPDDGLQDLKTVDDVAEFIEGLL
ncbi:MAG: acyl carrier protein [Ruminococcaceae bacterium]|nr:acyl carrier protein [Oscillospiraceae bacterium]